MEKQVYSAAIFDLDGTIIDSMQDMLICMKEAYGKEGIFNAKPEKKHIGPTLLECLKSITPWIGPGLLDKVAKNFCEVYDKSSYPNTLVYPGIRELFEILQLRKMPVYLVTNKRFIPTNRILKRIGLEVFKAVISPDCQAGKKLNKTEMLSFLLNQEGLDPNNAVYIGDAVSDIKSAKNNGLKTIAVTYGYTGEDELKKASPDHFAKDPESIKNTLLGLIVETCSK